ncbi:MAG: cytochrome C oxidase subunit IV family protein [Chloroflexi bacterium]|nr:cytochrome C oxidase subunit IV family protein [Chloroflexota bacterium]
MKKKKANALQSGTAVLIGLAVLTLVEYGVSFLETPTIALFIISLFKAGLIMNYFMHVGLLWSGEENH